MRLSLDQLKAAGDEVFPGLIGVRVESIVDSVVRAALDVRDDHLAPNGFLHAAVVVGLADTACGYGCFLSLPEGGVGFTTVELKTNFVASVQNGTIHCEARLVHGGRTTQLWDATVSADDRALAHFRCTQLMLR